MFVSREEPHKVGRACGPDERKGGVVGNILASADLGWFVWDLPRDRGVVGHDDSAKSGERNKHFGVLPSQAKRRCPKLLLVEPNMFHEWRYQTVLRILSSGQEFGLTVIQFQTSEQRNRTGCRFRIRGRRERGLLRPPDLSPSLLDYCQQHQRERKSPTTRGAAQPESRP